jgi:hypothetical protein
MKTILVLLFMWTSPVMLGLLAKTLRNLDSHIFFEHMMFQVSENTPTEEHFKLISDAGGPLNGSSNCDRTNYYETASSNQLELIL